MAASSSKPTGVHFALIFFVMATLLCALSLYLVAKEWSKEVAKAQDATQRATQANSERDTALGQVQLLRDRLGYQTSPIGALEDTGSATLLGQLGDDLKKLGADQVQPNAQSPTVRATLPAMRALIDGLNTQMAQAQLNIRSLTLELEAERKKFADGTAVIQKSQADSEGTLQVRLASITEQLAAKDREINRWTNEYRQAMRNKEAVEDAYNKYQLDAEQEMNLLKQIAQDSQRKMTRIENASFDVPDGKIVRVDNTTRTVWIDLGFADGLRNQVSFSVYVKNHQGVGRGKEDIKAKIEVTEIRDDHLAQARIVQDDITRPIQIQDPIYSPVWERGMKEHFSFVGILDLDGDGKDDIELFRNILETNGAGVEVFVNQAGERSPPEGHLTPRTKFLVIGRLEDPTDFPTGDTVKQDQIKKVAEQAKQLDDEALARGIKTVNIRDFLNYMGYQTQQRLFVPGEKGTFQLKAGAHSTGVNEGAGEDRFSEGRVSDRFNKENLKRFGDGTLENPGTQNNR